MSTNSLSPRMQVIVEFAMDEKIIADIGCDHGKVSVELARIGAKVYAVDISEPSLKKARELAKTEGLEHKIEFYCDDGLNSIYKVNFDAIVIAGMGWRMIGNILEKNKQCVKEATKLILQPMDSVIELRRYLCNNKYTIIDEKLVVEEGRLHTIVVAKCAKSKKLTLKQILIGPRILENCDELIPKLIKIEIQKRDKKLKGLNMAKAKDEEQIKQIEKEIKTITNVSEE